MLFLAQNSKETKISSYLYHRKNIAGCSSARLEYTSGGRVVASSNLVIPTMHSGESPQSQDWGFFVFYTPDACIKGVWKIKNIHCVDDSLHFALCTPLREPPRKALSEADLSLRSSQFCHSVLMLASNSSLNTKISTVWMTLSTLHCAPH